MHVFKPRRRKGAKSVAATNYSGRFRLSGDPEWRTVALKVTDKEVARRKLADLVRQLEREEAGLEPAQAVVAALRRPLPEHLAEYLGDVAAKGRSDGYVYNLRARCRRLFRECGWRCARDISVESFLKWRAGQGNKAPKTLNEFLDAARSFLNWMHRVGRIPANPLVVVEKVQTRGRERRVRRAFTLDELRRLLAVAGERRSAYLVAAFTGLRRNELAHLLVADVRLGEPVPFLMVRAATTKNRKSARIELHADVIAALSELRLETLPGNLPVFRRLPTVGELRADEAAAGIPFRDELGRLADFHAFRHTFTTMLAQAGVPPQVAKELTRHSDLRMNGHYTDATRLPLANVIRALPSALEHYAHICAQKIGAEGQNGALLDASAPRETTGGWAVEKSKNLSKTPENGSAPKAVLPSGPLVAGLGFEPRTFRL